MTQGIRQITKDELETASRSLISARQTNLGWEIELPVVYPTGQCVSVVVAVAGGDYIVHDAGFGSMYLTSAGVAMTKKLIDRLSRIAASYGCNFISGRMSRTCNEQQLSVAIALVANASKAIGDHLAETRRRKIRDFRQEVSTVISDNLGENRKLDRDRVVGESGTTYQVNFVLLDKAEQKPIAYVEPVSDSDAVNVKFREFFDIQQNVNFSQIDRITVYDDRADWHPGDLLLLNKVSNTVAFKDLGRRLQRLAS